jgi:hypothetical protein
MAANRYALHAEAQALETAARAFSEKVKQSYIDLRINDESYCSSIAHLKHVTNGLQMAKFALSEFMEEPK